MAPSIAGRQAAKFWKFWTAGDEVYALSRGGDHLTKISVHHSDQIHIRLGEAKRQRLAGPLSMGNGAWLHAFELRFLLSADAFRPPEDKRKNWQLIEVPENAILHLNLIVGRTQNQNADGLPHELLPGAHVLWSTALRGKRPVVLIGRLFPTSDENRAELRYIREELRPRANLSKAPSKPLYVEVMRVRWSPGGGNVLFVVPMGREGYHVEGDPAPPINPSEPPAPAGRSELKED